MSIPSDSNLDSGLMHPCTSDSIAIPLSAVSFDDLDTLFQKRKELELDAKQWVASMKSSRRCSHAGRLGSGMSDAILSHFDQQDIHRIVSSGLRKARVQEQEELAEARIRLLMRR